METGMSEQELDRVAVMSLRRAGKISQAEAARRLGVSTRQVRRLEARCQGKVEMSAFLQSRNVRLIRA